MSISLIKLYEAMIAKAIDTNVYSDTHAYNALFNGDRLLKAANALRTHGPHNALTNSTPFPSSDTRQSTDPLLINANATIFNNNAPHNTPSPVPNPRDDKLKDPLVQKALALFANQPNGIPGNPNPAGDKLQDPLVKQANADIYPSAHNPLTNVSPYPVNDLRQSVDPLVKQAKKDTYPTQQNIEWNDRLQYGYLVNPETLAIADPLVKQAQQNLYGTDYFAKNQYSDKNEYAPIASTVGRALGNFDVFAIANWLRNISQEFGIIGRPGQTTGERIQSVAKGAAFFASQFLLSTFNPGDPQYGGVLNQLYNPLSIGLSALPIVRAFPVASPNLAVARYGDVYTTMQSALPASQDRHLLLRQGLYVKALNATDATQGNFPAPGYIGDIATGRPFGVSIEAQVGKEGQDGIAVSSLPLHTNFYTVHSPYGSNTKATLESIEKALLDNPSLTAEQVQLRALFKDVPNLPDTTKYTWLYNQNASSLVQVGAHLRDQPDTSVAFPEDTDGGYRKEPVPDNENYMPFMFQDLRDNPPCYLYFRAFLHEGLTEHFAPTWQSERYYGRIDEVPTYQNTSRRMNLSFDVVAFAPEDLSPMWQKLHKLQSMVYPTFDTANFLKAGPLVRMRIGDLVCATTEGNVKKGLPGYISSLDFSYDSNIWNVTDNQKVPRKVRVDLGYTVIHEGNPGIYNNGAAFGNVFGTLQTLVAPPVAGADSPTKTSTSVQPGNIRGIVTRWPPNTLVA